MKKEELISVIIPTYERKAYLKNAINSVLSQTYKNVEIIIMDDCSSDGTYELIKKEYDQENIKIYKNAKNMGPGKSRKKALEKYAHGEYIIFLDDDDKFINNSYFEKAITLFNKYKNLSMVAAPHILVNTLDNTKTEVPFNYKEKVNNIDYFMNFCSEGFPKPVPSVTIFNLKALKFANYTKMKILNDTTIFLNCLVYGDMGFINEYSCEYLIHGNNISFNCSLNFIIDNLNEKYQLYKKVKTNNKFKELDLKGWFYKQIDTTIIYYIKGSKPKFFDFNKILIWTFMHTKSMNKIKEYFRIYKNYYNKKKEV